VLEQIVFHIGMGKTGTTSIQMALQMNRQALLDQGVNYLGMWFDMIDPGFAGLAGHEAFFTTSPETMTARTRQFVRYMDAASSQTGATRFIMSNEDFIGRFYSFVDVIDELRKHCKVSILAYARDPREWLPSAYSQWSILHKSYTGGMRSFSDISRSLIRNYSALLLWKDRFPDEVEVRVFDPAIDVVADFAGVLGLELVHLPGRALERLTESELLLRAFYNFRLNDSVLPQAFSQAFRDINFSSDLGIAQIAAAAFDHSSVDEIVGSHAALFDEIRNRIGIDLLAAPPVARQPVDVEGLRQRALDQALLILMHQADRITQLEQAVAQLRSEWNRR
jgi:hypothetical protein